MATKKIAKKDNRIDYLKMAGSAFLAIVVYTTGLYIGDNALAFSPFGQGAAVIAGVTPLQVTMAGPSIASLGQRVHFTAKAVGGTAPYVYSWVFPNGVTFSGNDVYWTGAKPLGVQPVSLAVKDATGKVALAQKFTIKVVETKPAIVNFRLSPSSPASIRNMDISASKVTKDVVLGVFGFQSQFQNSNILGLLVGDTDKQPVSKKDLYTNVRLYNSAGQIVATTNNISSDPIGSAGFWFDNINLPLVKDQWSDFTLKADINPNGNNPVSLPTLFGPGFAGRSADGNTADIGTLYVYAKQINFISKP